MNSLITSNNCCVCFTNPGKFVPVQCDNKYKSTVHTICDTCWWDIDNCFSNEFRCHKCPGCLIKNAKKCN